jgi:hypothetical protein
MDGLPQISSDKVKEYLRRELDEVAEKIAAAVNAAGAGRLIDDSEEPVRDVMDELRRGVFEMAIQEKVNAAEAAFPPSKGLIDEQTDA